MWLYSLKRSFIILLFSSLIIINSFSVVSGTGAKIPKNMHSHKKANCLVLNKRALKHANLQSVNHIKKKLKRIKAKMNLAIKNDLRGVTIHSYKSKVGMYSLISDTCYWQT